jgi:hypothetical protein
MKINGFFGNHLILYFKSKAAFDDITDHNFMAGNIPSFPLLPIESLLQMQPSMFMFQQQLPLYKYYPFNLLLTGYVKIVYQL